MVDESGSGIAIPIGPAGGARNGSGGSIEHWLLSLYGVIHLMINESHDVHREKFRLGL